MRFIQIIHPEIILGRRGNRAEREAMMQLVSQVSIVDGGLKASKMLMAMGDVNLVDALALMRKWKDSERAVYHSGGDFLVEIAKVDRAIPVDRLPDRFLSYLSFGKNIIYDEEDAIQGAYVFIGPAHETSFGHENYVSGPSAKVLWIAYMTLGGKAGVVRVELKQSVTVKELLSGVPASDMTFGDMRDTNEITCTQREIVFRTVINLVLYIHQPDPELEKLIPHSNLIGRKREQISEKADKGTAVFNSCTLPVTFVNWRWHRPVAEHTVTGHFKWQPCGEGHRERKLIYVEAYERGGREIAETVGAQA